MGMTITEKILANAAGKESVAPGDNIWVNADILLTHDVCGPGTVGVLRREFGEDAMPWDREKVVIIPDHYIYTEDKMCHRNVEFMNKFAAEAELPYYYQPGTDNYKGVCHVALPQEGHVQPGKVIFGTDSHTCSHGAFGAFATGIGNTDAGFLMGTGKLLVKVPASKKFILNGKMPKHVMAKDIILEIIGTIGVDGATYQAMEFCGSTLEDMEMDERITICNMAIEAGGKNGIIAPDEITMKYVNERNIHNKEFTCFHSDEDANYKSVYEFDIANLDPVVALPHSPDNKAYAKDCGDLKVDRAYIGSCTGGKIEDFIRAAELMEGHKVKIHTFLVPATREVEQLMKTTKLASGKTLVEVFEEAGCEKPAPPSCAACLGGPIDTYGRINNSDRCISTTNRNFIGRMGSKTGEVVLASPLTVAASALTGFITDPREFIK